MARRARSAERAGGQEDVLARLTEMLQAAFLNPGRQGRTDRFRSPTFDGSSDVNFFIRQFEEVAEANDWDRAAARIHLRAALTDTAAACGQAETVEGIINALRARFGMTAREAKAQLVTLRRHPTTKLQEHAELVERLVNVAYADFPRLHKEDMKMDIFHSTLNQPSLQRHLLAVPTPTLEAAIQAGNEYLQIKPSGDAIRQIEEPDVARANSDPLSTLMDTVSKLAEEVRTLRSERRTDTNRPPRDNTNSRATRCYGCNREGHLRRHCPSAPWNRQTTGSPSSGNGFGPQQ